MVMGQIYLQDNIKVKFSLANSSIVKAAVESAAEIRIYIYLFFFNFRLSFFILIKVLLMSRPLQCFIGVFSYKPAKEHRVFQLTET